MAKTSVVLEKVSCNGRVAVKGIHRDIGSGAIECSYLAACDKEYIDVVCGAMALCLANSGHSVYIGSVKYVPLKVEVADAWQPIYKPNWQPRSKPKNMPQGNEQGNETQLLLTGIRKAMSIRPGMSKWFAPGDVMVEASAELAKRKVTRGQFTDVKAAGAKAVKTIWDEFKAKHKKAGTWPPP